MDKPNEIEMFSPEEMQSPFDAIKETDAEGREWWNSRKLAQIDAMVGINNIDNSYEATQFRIWARGVLKEYIIKGYVMDDERLKGNHPFGEDYFEDLLERISEIRKSGRSNCQKITDIYAEFSCDYDPKSEIAKMFYKTMRNMIQKDNDLNLLTVSLLGIAERRVRRHVLTKMTDWEHILNHYLLESDNALES